MRSLAALVAAPLLALGLAACGGGDEEAPGQTQQATPEQSPADASPATASAVDEYCRQVDEYAAEARKLIDDPLSGDPAALQQKAQELQETATELTQELIDDPSQAERVQECTTRLQEALVG
jgi:hypothetical protein